MKRKHDLVINLGLILILMLYWMAWISYTNPVPDDEARLQWFLPTINTLVPPADEVAQSGWALEPIFNIYYPHGFEFLIKGIKYAGLTGVVLDNPFVIQLLPILIISIAAFYIFGSGARGRLLVLCTFFFPIFQVSLRSFHARSIYLASIILVLALLTKIWRKRRPSWIFCAFASGVFACSIKHLAAIYILSIAVMIYLLGRFEPRNRKLFWLPIQSLVVSMLFYPVYLTWNYAVRTIHFHLTGVSSLEGDSYVSELVIELATLLLPKVILMGIAGLAFFKFYKWLESRFTDTLEHYSIWFYRVFIRRYPSIWIFYGLILAFFHESVVFPIFGLVICLFALFGFFRQLDYASLKDTDDLILESVFTAVLLTSLILEIALPRLESPFTFMYLPSLLGFIIQVRKIESTKLLGMICFLCIAISNFYPPYGSDPEKLGGWFHHKFSQYLFRNPVHSNLNWNPSGIEEIQNQIFGQIKKIKCASNEYKVLTYETGNTGDQFTLFRDHRYMKCKFRSFTGLPPDEMESIVTGNIQDYFKNLVESGVIAGVVYTKNEHELQRSVIRPKGDLRAYFDNNLSSLILNQNEIERLFQTSCYQDKSRVSVCLMTNNLVTAQ